MILLGSIATSVALVIALNLGAHQLLQDLAINLSASLVTGTIAIIFIGYLRWANNASKTRPAVRLAKSSIDTMLYGTILDLAQIYLDQNDFQKFLKMKSWEDYQNETSKIVSRLKAIKYTRTDIDFQDLPKSLHTKIKDNIYEIDQTLRLYSYVLPSELQTKLLELRSDYRELDFVLWLHPDRHNLSKTSKTIIALTIFKLKMTVAATYLMVRSINVDQNISLVEN